MFLFMEEKNFIAVAAFAAGARVLNGYFIYPDRELHHLLFRNAHDELVRHVVEWSALDFGEWVANGGDLDILKGRVFRASAKASPAVFLLVHVNQISSFRMCSWWS